MKLSTYIGLIILFLILVPIVYYLTHTGNIAGMLIGGMVVGVIFMFVVIYFEEVEK